MPDVMGTPPFSFRGMSVFQLVALFSLHAGFPGRFRPRPAFSGRMDKKIRLSRGRPASSEKTGANGGAPTEPKEVPNGQ